jgi:NADH-quinone oxidoreductase subunit G
MTVSTSSTGGASKSKDVSTGSTAEVEKSDEVTLTIDGVEVSVPKNTLVIRAAERVGVQIPRFCDHPLLAPVGACRQCLVEVPDGGNGRPIPKPQASCTITVAEGMVVNTQATSAVADKAQQGQMEFLLINHPLDCPVCDKGGECPLQNQAMSNGRGETRFAESKRLFPKPINISANVLLDRERCVLCARCTRFSEQIAGDPFITLIERGALQQVGIYEKEPFESYFSGNTIQICPVGALTSSAYRFRSRPFDLVSTPSIAEHDACGSAIRVDHRRGKVMRRLSGDDPEVNEEWITDKDRFAFTYAGLDRLSYPMVRDTLPDGGGSGELRPASWPEAFVVAARGLAAARDAGGVGVLTGGRLTAEDSYAYSKFARVALGTNDIDFRARAHSAEEAEFLAANVVLGGPGADPVSYADLESARSVVMVGLEPEDEAGTIFLRLRKAARGRLMPIYSIAPYTSRGLHKMTGTLIPTRPGDEAAALDALAHDPTATSGQTAVPVDKGTVILVGERMAAVPGALAAASRLAATTGARIAWIPRRAGDRGAVETGALPNLLPGGRPVADASARVDLATAWGVEHLPETPGRDGNAIVAAAAAGELGGLVIGGVDPLDLPDPALVRQAVENAGFVVSLELRASEITSAADVVFPIAPVTDRTGTFVNWEGRVRQFGKVLHNPNSLPDLRVLAGITEELGFSLGWRTTEQVWAEMTQVGPWDGERAAFDHDVSDPGITLAEGEFVLASWKQLIDDGRMQDGDDAMRATARKPIVLVGQATLTDLGVAAGDLVTLTGPLGSLELPVGVADLAERTVWAPASAPGASVRHLVGPAGSTVTITGGAQ